MKKIKRNIHYEGKFRRFLSVNSWEFVERLEDGGIVVIFGRTPDKKVVLVEQYRVPVGNHVIEFPAGLVSDLPQYKNETYESAAKRELLEESGYETKKLTQIFCGPTSAATAADILTFFVATDLKKVGQGGGDEYENIKVHTIPMSKVDGWLKKKTRQGLYIDPKVYAGLYFLKSLKK